jgi:JmjC domain, hydroxylase/C5HC2 zinc finger/jmjN domain
MTGRSSSPPQPQPQPLTVVPVTTTTTAAATTTTEAATMPSLNTNDRNTSIINNIDVSTCSGANSNTSSATTKAPPTSDTTNATATAAPATTTASTTTTTTMGNNKRKRITRKPYHISAAEHIENRCLVQAIQNSKVDQTRLKFQDSQQHPSLPQQQHAAENHTNTSNSNSSSDENHTFPNSTLPQRNDAAATTTTATAKTGCCIPMGPIFYPTHAQFYEMHPIEYIEQHVRPIAELYGICKIVPPTGWNVKSHFHIPIVPKSTTESENNSSSNNNSTHSSSVEEVQSNSSTNCTATSTPSQPPASIPLQQFETKYQLLHRLQEGLDFQDGKMYDSVQYVQMAYTQTQQYKQYKYPQHDLLTRHYSSSTAPPSQKVNSTSKTNHHNNDATNHTQTDTIENQNTSTSTIVRTNTTPPPQALSSASSLSSSQVPLATVDADAVAVVVVVVVTPSFKGYSDIPTTSNIGSVSHNDSVPNCILSPSLSDSNSSGDATTSTTATTTTGTSLDYISNTSNMMTNNIAKHLYTIPNLEQDYWDIVERVGPSTSTDSPYCCNKVVVEYGNDVDTHIYGSGFPLSYDANQSIYTATRTTRPEKSTTTTVTMLDENTSTTTENTSHPSPSNVVIIDLSELDDEDESINGNVSNVPDLDGIKKEEAEEEDAETKLKKLFVTEDYYRETWWNLNNIPCSPDSVLRHVKVAMNGINVPWMYYGSLFTTFCWHNEDNYLYSINYHHMGSPKQWYGVPGIPKDAPDGLEKVFRSYLSMKMRDVPDLLHHITTMFSPRLLQNVNVPVCKMVQYEGEYIVTFPRAYHCGFSYGPNIGEAVNFATHDWISYGADANEKYRTYQRPAVFSHDRLTFTMANHCEQDQTSYDTCKLLLNELQRVIDEELSLRNKLLQSGVRDVSHLIHLRKNRCDQLDEESANYDDQRTCHECKHVCFFTAVACQCSQRKVSCLRHSHYMCACRNTSKYLMIWSQKDELLSTLERVKKHCDYLQHKEGKNDTLGNESTKNDSLDRNKSNKKWQTTLPDIAPGVQEDYERHKNVLILTDPMTWIPKRG